MSDNQQTSVNIVSNGQCTKPESSIETIVIDPDSTIIDLVACRLQTIEGLDDLRKIEILNMRQNFISKIENLSQLTTLKHIDLYDNHIGRIEGLDSLIQLKHIDLSFSMLNRTKNV